MLAFIRQLVSPIVVLGIWLSLGSTDGFGQLASRKDSLRGHQKVFLSVSLPDSPDIAQNLGLKKSSLERYLVDRLVEQQVPVTTSFTNETLILEVRVDLHPVLEADQQTVYAFLSEFEATQVAVLAANHQGSLVTTWQATQFGAVTRNEAQRLRESVLKNLDQFIADWKAAQTAATVPAKIAPPPRQRDRDRERE